jgi:serine/threonine protein kinase
MQKLYCESPQNVLDSNLQNVIRRAIATINASFGARTHKMGARKLITLPEGKSVIITITNNGADMTELNVLTRLRFCEGMEKLLQVLQLDGRVVIINKNQPKMLFSWVNKERKGGLPLLSEENIKRVAKELLLLLVELQQQNVVHRRISPLTVGLLESTIKHQGKVILTSFGKAKLFIEEDGTETQFRSEPCQAPEIKNKNKKRNTKPFTAQSDLWSAVALIFWLFVEVDVVNLNCIEDAFARLSSVHLGTTERVQEAKLRPWYEFFSKTLIWEVEDRPTSDVAYNLFVRLFFPTEPCIVPWEDTTTQGLVVPVPHNKLHCARLREELFSRRIDEEVLIGKLFCTKQEALRDMVKSNLDEVVWLEDETMLEFHELLGRGGEGDVWSATWGKTLVAVKSFNEHSEEAKKQEIEALQQLRHCPYVVKLLAVSPNNLVLELFDTTLDKMFSERKDKTFNLEETLELAMDLFSALNWLAQYGLWHRDIKPQNIGIKYGCYKLCDFGCSGSYQPALPFGRVEEHGKTPLWAPPEAHDGPAYSEKYDIFSTCLVLYYALVGAGPWKDKEEQKAAYAKGLPILLPPQIGPFHDLLSAGLAYKQSERADLRRMVELLAAIVNPPQPTKEEPRRTARPTTRRTTGSRDSLPRVARVSAIGLPSACPSSSSSLPSSSPSSSPPSSSSASKKETQPIRPVKRPRVSSSNRAISAAKMTFATASPSSPASPSAPSSSSAKLETRPTTRPTTGSTTRLRVSSSNRVAASSSSPASPSSPSLSAPSPPSLTSPFSPPSSSPSTTPSVPSAHQIAKPVPPKKALLKK